VFKRRRRQPPPGSGLHQCPLCHDDFVVPVDADPLDHGHWDLRLRCGQCGTYRDVVVSDDVANRYSDDLDRGMAEIAAALREQDRERMTAEAQVFIAALEHDLIDGGDFASGR
jgi:transcription elongation factor Elf1